MERFQDYVNGLINVAKVIDEHQIENVFKELEKAKLNKKNVYICGNGGSASTAEHWVNDFIKIGGVRAFSLTTLPVVTAFVNDKSYDSVFEEQLKVLLGLEDVVIGISGSGNSKNVVNALKYSIENNGRSVGILGFDGGLSKQFCHANIITPTKDYGILEDLHMSIDHYLVRKLKNV